MKNIQIKNYKSFKECFIEIKPITILLGANSTGKSAIINLIMMLLQSNIANKSLNGSLKVNGEYASLGEIENIFYFQKTDEEIEIDFKFDFVEPDVLVKEGFNKLFNDIETLKTLIREITEISNDEQLKELNEIIIKTENIGDEFTALRKPYLYIRTHYAKLHNVVNKTLSDNSKEKVTLKTLSDNSKEKVTLKTVKKKDFYLQKLSEVKNYQYDEMIDIINFLSSMDEFFLNETEFNISYKFKFNNQQKKIQTSGIKIFTENKIFFSIFLGPNGKQEIESSFITEELYDKYRNKFHSKLDYYKPFTQVINENYIEGHSSRFCKQIYYFMNIFNKKVQESFTTNLINHITPLRAYPKRYYNLMANTSNMLDGENLTEILKDEDQLHNKVDEWLIKYGLAVKIEELSELIHKLKIGQSGLNLDITDVGFGISQVLPIIIQSFLSPKNSLTIIEQPEIHLHPKMQADLADLFIEVAKEDNKSILIETHSEYLLKRLRTRMAESIIDPADVAIYYLEKNENGVSIIKKVDVHHNGSFEWPKGFYETDYQDTINYVKALAQQNADYQCEVD